ncbi:MAG: hypothetical protein LBM75_01010 [Myxococcales bacterium]|jgi:hypothetical protein|nr:hypothetical protein [Myxococcales bacterium]
MKKRICKDGKSATEKGLACASGKPAQAKGCFKGPEKKNSHQKQVLDRIARATE